MTESYHCPNCASQDIFVREAASLVFELVAAVPEDNYYETGDEVGRPMLTSAEMFCTNCDGVFEIEEIVVETMTEEEESGSHIETFPTVEAAAAFAHGIEYTNDSSLQVSGPFPGSNGSFYVEIEEVE